jgi:hypothetical protein
MTIEYKYQAKRRFKYAGKQYEKGDEWEPQGGKFDDQIKAYHVYLVAAEKRPAPRRKKATSDTSSK